MGENGIISVYELAQMVVNPQPSLLIVDCRLFSDYNQGHVRNAVNAFYSKLMRRRLSCGKVDADFLVSHLLGTIEDKESLGPSMNLVLYGGNEEMEQISRPTGLCLKRKLEGCPLKCVSDSLPLNNNNNNNNKESSAKICRLLKSKLDTVDCFSSVLMLEGGFSSFSSAFPSLIESTSSPSLPPILLSPLPHSAHPSSAPPSMHSQVPGGSQSQPCLSERPNGPTMILPFLYLGSQQDAMNTEMLKECGIEYVMNLSVTCPRAISVKDDEEHFLRIPVNDSYMDKLYPYFNDAFQFLEKVRENKKIVLVHCLAGISRSPTMCISYIMKYLKMDSEDAYKFVKARRSTISPNFNFMGQLLEYERRLRDEGILPMKETKEKLDCSPLEKSSRPNSCLAPLMKMPKMPKSSSSHAILTSSSRSRIPKEEGVREEDEETEEEFPSTERNENGKREMQSTPPRSESGSGFVSAPSPPPEEVQRPKMLFSRPRRLDEKPSSSSLAPSPKNEELPSPSTELSKLSFDPSTRRSPLPHRRPLDLSFSMTSSFSANPCFVSPQEVHMIRREECGVQGKAPSTSSTSTANPIFVSPSSEEPSSSKSKESYFSRLSNIFKRNSHSVSRPDCLEKSGEPHHYSHSSSRLSSDSLGSSLLSSSTGVSRSSIHTGSHLSSLPEHSDESGYAHSSTDSFRMARDDPERASLGSTSSHEITVN
uniref:protein-tyrosine-phosphatase n=1 Tax=Pristionchus pacificus TaxID=54126 RepID=A0A8R1YIG8_PRIPA